MNFLASLFGNQNQTKMTTSEERVKNENKIKNEELLDMQIPVIVNENEKDDRLFRSRNERYVENLKDSRQRSASEERVMAEKAARIANLPENNKLSDSFSNVDSLKGQLSYTKQVAPTYDASKVGKLVGNKTYVPTEGEMKLMAAQEARMKELAAIRKAKEDAKAAAVKVGGNNYYAKYLKYKQKYLTLKSQGF